MAHFKKIVITIGSKWLNFNLWPNRCDPRVVIFFIFNKNYKPLRKVVVEISNIPREVDV